MMLFLLLYLWPHHATDTLAARIAPPPGATRVAVADGSFGAWLRGLPLLPPGSAVHLFDGSVKPRQDVHHAVVDLDVQPRDLQQCADAVMRLYAEYLYAAKKPIAFHPDPGKPRTIDWSGGERRAFEKFLIRLFADAGTASLAAELPRARGPVQPGETLIHGGYPGHAVLVLDVAVARDGRRLLLLGQSYMPAQQFHVLKNLEDPSLSPWFDAAALDGAGLKTPEWRPFFAADRRRF
jgi:hypothetical protein